MRRDKGPKCVNVPLWCFILHPQNSPEGEGSWGLRAERVGVKGLARRPTGNLTVRAGAALAAVSSTSAGPRDQLLTVSVTALYSVLSACTPLRPWRPACCGLWVGMKLTPQISQWGCAGSTVAPQILPDALSTWAGLRGTQRLLRVQPETNVLAGGRRGAGAGTGTLVVAATAGG